MSSRGITPKRGRRNERQQRQMLMKVYLHLGVRTFKAVMSGKQFRPKSSRNIKAYNVPIRQRIAHFLDRSRHLLRVHGSNVE